MPQIERKPSKIVEIVEQPVGLRKQLIRLRRRHQAPLDALEQAKAELILGLQDDLAKRRLRDIEGLGGAGHGARTHDGPENLELSGPHLSSHKFRLYTPTKCQLDRASLQPA